MLFDRTTEGLTAAVYYTGLRHRVIANNIANADTPGYEALDISFRQQLEDFMKVQRADNSRFGSCSRILPSPTPVLTSGSSSQRPRMDRNTVDIDRELSKLSQNTILHNTYLQILNSRFRTLKSAISGNV